MPGKIPSEAFVATDFPINTPVMHQVNSKEMDRTVGRVVDIDKKANRVWVQFPSAVRGLESIDPSELIVATPAMGECLVPEVPVGSGKSAASIKENMSPSGYRLYKQASNIAGHFEMERVRPLKDSVRAYAAAGDSESQAYAKAYYKYAGEHSDSTIKSVVADLYRTI